MDKWELLKMAYTLVIGGLAGWGVYCLVSLAMLSKTERLYLKSFFQALLDGRYKEILPEDDDHDEA